MRLGLVTTRPLPEPDVDEELMLTGFRSAGFQPELVDWRTSFGEGCDLLVIRSTWDYYLYVVEFREWLQVVGSRVWNPAEVCLWNLDKRYLRELEGKGVRIVPTIWPSGEFEIPWARFVVKPSISAGSFNTRVFEDEAEGRAFIAEVQDAMVQPYMESVSGEGERSIIWIDGAVTHAIRKNPRFSHEDESVSPAYSPTDEERAFVETVMAAAPGPLMYARIDVMRDADGELCLSELELIEPSLFLTQNPGALDHLVAAVGKRLESRV